MWKTKYNTAHGNGGRWRHKKFKTLLKAQEFLAGTRERYNHDICTSITNIECGETHGFDCRCAKMWICG